MKQPKSKLPWLLLDSSGKTRTVIDNGGDDVRVYWSDVEDKNFISTVNGDEVLGSSEWLRLDDEDAEYIIYACNSLPESIRLLQRVYASSLGLLNEDLRSEISAFLNK